MFPRNSDVLHIHISCLFVFLFFLFFFFFFPFFNISPVVDLNTGFLIFLFLYETRFIISYGPLIMYENSFSGHWFFLFCPGYFPTSLNQVFHPDSIFTRKFPFWIFTNKYIMFLVIISIRKDFNWVLSFLRASAPQSDF